MALPGGILGPPRWRATDEDGNVLPGALLYSWETGGAFSTPQALYSSSALTVALSNPVVADAGGLFPACFQLPIGYDIQLKTADDVLVYSALNVADIGQIFLSDLGITMGTGALDVVSGYTILSTDNFVTVDSTGGANPCIINLQPAADRGFPLFVKNMGTIALSLTPDGAESIDSVAGAFTVPAASSPTFPSVMLLSDGSSNYWVAASHGF